MTNSLKFGHMRVVWAAITSLVFSLFSTGSRAQQVESAAYGITLKALLDHSVPEVEVKEAKALHGQAQFIDSRERKEYEVSHIAGAAWVGYDDFEIERVAQLDKSKPVLVYCSVGYRSEKISEKLIAEGFEDVRNLYGGIFEWVNSGYPVVGADGNETDSVHAYDRVWGIWLNRGKKVY